MLYANVASKNGEGEPLLSQAKWPKLRSVRLGAVRCSPETTGNFFIAHPTITDLSISEDVLLGVEGAGLPTGILPQLEKLDCKLQNPIAILESLPSPHPISHIGLYDAYFDYPPKDRLYNLLGRFSNLERLGFVRTLLPEDIDRIAEVALKLEWLRLAYWSETQEREVRLHDCCVRVFVHLTSSSQDAYISALTRFPQIKTVEGIQFFSSEPLKRDDPKLLELLRRLPTLRRIDAWAPDPLDRYYRPVLLLR
jgi:hypothetical protein